MLLTPAELSSLVEFRHSTPHQLLGMHPLGDGSGVVVRALVPDAVSIEIEPTSEKNQPSGSLKKIADCGLFEAVIKGPKRVYAYNLVIKDGSGQVRKTRDAYSFLPTLGDGDLFLFGKGDERRIYEKLGSHLRVIDGVPGCSFAVWAPNAQRISIAGDFNGWDGRYHPMRSLGSSGVWEIFIPGVAKGAHYKFEVRDAFGQVSLKTDPYGRFFEVPPKNAAIVWDEGFEWDDQPWLEARSKQNALRSPMSVYELHVGSWKKKNSAESYSYRELAEPLIAYLKEMGFTHVEFMPLAEHAFYPSWGYQVTGYYAPTSRFGTPEELKFLINEMHKAGIGVIVDWVPAHFPRDEWALAKFDGTALYEHEDPRKGAHQDWGTLIPNYSRHEVSNFMMANALFWCDCYHIDGLRVDGVASMLYLDYSRNEGEWIPNEYGGRENIEAIEFLKKFNHITHMEYPGVVTIAEESTAWPMVTKPPYMGGLGFDFKWNMGWMHDTLDYFTHEPVHRKYHQHDLTFATLYQHHENFVLPLSHDEVVHGKRSLLGRMPGDDWQRFANMRALLGYQWTFPGKKLLFMGDEIGQSAEWNVNGEVDWWLLDQGPYHAGLKRFVADLNRLYVNEGAFWDADHDPMGFYWIDCSDNEASVLSWVRQDHSLQSRLAVIVNLTPVPRSPYRVGLPAPGRWTEVLNSDAEIYGGSNQGNNGGVIAREESWRNFPNYAEMNLPPLSITVLKYEG